MPDLRVNPHLYWGKGDWSAALTGYYMSGQEDEVAGTKRVIGSHFEMGLNVGYQLPWNASISIGAVNLTNEDPEIDGTSMGLSLGTSLSMIQGEGLLFPIRSKPLIKNRWINLKSGLSPALFLSLWLSFLLF